MWRIFIIANAICVARACALEHSLLIRQHRAGIAWHLALDRAEVVGVRIIPLATALLRVRLLHRGSARLAWLPVFRGGNWPVAGALQLLEEALRNERMAELVI